MAEEEVRRDERKRMLTTIRDILCVIGALFGVASFFVALL